jgi:hypothetical protein
VLQVIYEDEEKKDELTKNTALTFEQNIYDNTQISETFLELLQDGLRKEYTVNPFLASLRIEMTDRGFVIRTLARTANENATNVKSYTFNLTDLRTAQFFRDLGFSRLVNSANGTLVIPVDDTPKTHFIADHYPTFSPDYVDVNINVPTLSFHSGGTFDNVIARIPLPVSLRSLLTWTNMSPELGQRIQGMHLSSLRIWLKKPNGQLYILPDDMHVSFHFQLQRQTL